MKKNIVKKVQKNSAATQLPSGKFTSGKAIARSIDWQKVNGLIPAVIQNVQTMQVLMLGYMNREAIFKTIRTKQVWFYSRTKKRLWMKGEVSKNILKVVQVLLDCDNDTLLLKVNPIGPTCHTGEITCFKKDRAKIRKNLNGSNAIDISPIQELFELIQNRKKTLPKGSYTAVLFQKGLDNICEKIYEEAAEVVRAAKKETPQRLIDESVDLLYHLLVLLVKKNLKIEQVFNEMKKRNS